MLSQAYLILPKKRPIRKIRNIAAIGLLFICNIPLLAQNHYWNQQFGAANTLTGGAEIAGVRDNTALFYNPGAMGFIQSNKISVSANVYEAEIVRLKNVAGQGVDGRSFRILIYPQFIGGTLFVKQVPKLKIMYGSMVRTRSNVRYNIEYETFTDVIKGSPGKEYYKARIGYESSTIETWAGLGFGYKLNEIFSVGLSLFGSYTNLENSSLLNLSTDAAYQNIPYTASVNENASVQINHINFIAKVGIAAEFNPIRLGLAITFPTAKIWGQGNLSKSFEGHNMNLHATDTNSVLFRYPSFLVSDDQRELPTLYRQPASFAFGGEYRAKKFKVKLSAEFFLGLPTYNVLKGKDQSFLRPVSAYGGEYIQDFMILKSSARPLINTSIGGTFKVKKNVKFLLGFRTDFNNRMNFTPNQFDKRLSSLSSAYWHLLHFSTGASYNRGANDITLGVNYSFGIVVDRASSINVTEPSHEQLLRGNLTSDMRSSINNIGVILGYTYFFRGSMRSSDTKTQVSEEW